MNRFYVVVDYGHRQPVEQVNADHWSADDGVLRFYDGANRKICAYRKWIKVTNG